MSHLFNSLDPVIHDFGICYRGTNEKNIPDCRSRAIGVEFRATLGLTWRQAFPMPTPDRFAAFVIEQLAPLGTITSRYMFGGWCLYRGGTVFAIIADGALFLKGDSENIPKFEARGLKPFRPFPDRDDVMKYFQAPPEIFEDPDAMRDWCGGAIAAGQRSSGKNRKRGK